MRNTSPQESISNLPANREDSLLQELLGQLRAIIILGTVIIKDFFFHRKTPQRRPHQGTGKNITIVGWDMSNRGLQALTFVAVDQLRRRFPEKEIYVLSSRDFHRTPSEKSLYRFSIIPWDLSTRIATLKSSAQQRWSSYSSLHENVQAIVRETSFFLDLSGYMLSSQWGVRTTLRYLLNIIIARSRAVPLYLLPQSVGPFDYHPYVKWLLIPLIKFYLQYPRIIFTREEHGFQLIQTIRKEGVVKQHDIVLMNRSYNLENVLSSAPSLAGFDVKPNSVAVIPNVRVLERMKETDFYSLFRSLITVLLDADRTVWLVRHSSRELSILETLKSFFPNCARVRLVEDDLNCLELEQLISQFDFIVSSRYHAIVHAYRHSVPALAIGWAVKYEELLTTFGQQQYCFDVQNGLSQTRILEQVQAMMQHWQDVKKSIAPTLERIRQEEMVSVFDRLASDFTSFTHSFVHD